MTLRRIAALAGLLLLAGCARRVAPTDAGPSPAHFYPLAVGHRWTYAVEFLGETREQQVEILKQQDGFFHDNQGGALSVDAFGVRDQKRYLLRAPVVAGRTWENVISSSVTEHYRVLEVGVACETRAGRFPDCVRVEARNRMNLDTTLVNVLTFAAGVGLVRVQVVAEAKGKKIPQTQLELTAYRLAR